MGRTGDANRHCIDVADRSKAANAQVRSWRCCCAGLPGSVCEPGRPCGDVKDNYNQVTQ